MKLDVSSGPIASTNYNTKFISNTNNCTVSTLSNIQSHLSKEQLITNSKLFHLRFTQYINIKNQPLKISFKVRDIPNLPLKFQTNIKKLSIRSNMKNRKN